MCTYDCVFSAISRLTVLHQAIAQSSEKVVECLLEHGAQLDLKVSTELILYIFPTLENSGTHFSA